MRAQMLEERRATKRAALQGEPAAGDPGTCQLRCVRVDQDVLQGAAEFLEGAARYTCALTWQRERKDGK